MNWQKVGSEFQFRPENALSHTDQHVFAFSPLNSNTFYIGNDGGLSRTQNGGVSFTSLSNTLPLAQLNSITSHPTIALTYAGSQDNGALIRQEGFQNWREFVGGDSGGCIVPPNDPSMLIATYVYGILNRFGQSTAKGPLTTVASNSTFDESDMQRPRIGFYPPFISDRTTGRLYFGTWKLFFSEDSGTSWQKLSDQDLTQDTSSANGPDVLSAIAVSPSNAEVIYTGSAQGRVMVTRNRGETWIDITSGLPRRFIKSVVVDSSEPTTVFLTVSGFGSGHVFKTIDGGTSWHDISGNLPNIPVNALIIDANSPNTLYIGTDVGVFRSTLDGNVWTPLNRGLPPAIVTGFSVTAAGRLQISTFGRGAYELIK
jgi:photosystem II stability/assembly factor-like uncharacterized protein